MIKRLIAYLTGGLVLSASLGVQAQGRTGMIEDRAFDRKVHDLIRFSVPTLSVQEAYKRREEFTFLDTRQREEFKTSRIPDAIYLGYRDPDWSILESISRDSPVVLYCSVGYRSEKMAEKLRERGFERVFNLYGSIFEWANRGYSLESPSGAKTYKIHTYSRKWSQYITNPEIEKTW